MNSVKKQRARRWRRAASENGSRPQCGERCVCTSYAQTLINRFGYSFAREPINELSVRQRCTVAPSILLQHPNRMLIVDQPEDHLENAFIVSIPTGAIPHHSERRQLIFSAHNANIPVLGAATRSIRLNSKGNRDFVWDAEPRHHRKAVQAITTLMEGGDEAFRERRAFCHRVPH